MTIKTQTSQSKKVRQLFRRMREICGISVIEMASRTAVPAAKLHKWEQHQRRLTLKEFHRLSEALDEAVVKHTSNAMLLSALGGPGGEARRERESSGITQLELAREMGENQSTISMMEGGWIVFNEEQKARHKVAMDKLKHRHAATDRQMLLFRDIVASLRREVAELQEQLAQREQGQTVEGGE